MEEVVDRVVLIASRGESDSAVHDEDTPGRGRIFDPQQAGFSRRGDESKHVRQGDGVKAAIQHRHCGTSPRLNDISFVSIGV
jgi:hypothetical protein